MLHKKVTIGLIYERIYQLGTNGFINLNMHLNKKSKNPVSLKKCLYPMKAHESVSIND